MTRLTAFRVLRRVAIGIFGLLVLMAAILRIQSYFFRQRAERLMADFQALKLHETPWRDAQQLMSRWGRFGGYKGDCNASFCRYSVILGSPMTGIKALMPADRIYHFVFPTSISPLFALYEILGGRSATLRTTFVVQDGIVVRKSAVFIYDHGPVTYPRDGYSLIATSRAASRLTDYRNWPLIGSNQLVEHPHYVVTRPGGCSFCLMANVTFTPDTPLAEMRQLTTFNLGCLTRLLPCRYLEDIYPAAEEWHLYDGTLGGRPEPANKASYPTEQPLGCRVPLFARGREADWIFSVAAVQESQERRPGEVVETAKVRLESILKGSTTYKPGQVLEVVSRSWRNYTPFEIETPLTPSQHFLLLPLDPRDKSHPIELERCLVLPDTPEIRAQLQQGINENDTLKYPDPNSMLFIPD
jgi:hypothetical protein